MQLRSLMGSIHHLQKFIPNLSQLPAPLSSNTSTQRKSKNSRPDLNEEHTKSFQQIKKRNHTNYRK